MVHQFSRVDTRQRAHTYDDLTSHEKIKRIDIPDSSDHRFVIPCFKTGYGFPS